jgi:hypothetical protein
VVLPPFLGLGRNTSIGFGTLFNPKSWLNIVLHQKTKGNSVAYRVAFFACFSAESR